MTERHIYVLNGGSKAGGAYICSRPKKEPTLAPEVTVLPSHLPSVAWQTQLQTPRNG